VVPGYRGAPQQGRQCLWYTRACNVTIRIQEFLLPRPNSEAHQIMALRAMFLKSLIHGNDERKRWTIIPPPESRLPNSQCLQLQHCRSASRHTTMITTLCFSGQPRLVANQPAPCSWLRIESYARRSQAQLRIGTALPPTQSRRTVPSSSGQGPWFHDLYDTLS